MRGLVVAWELARSTPFTDWFRNAPQLQLPDGVGFSVGAQTKIKYVNEGDQLDFYILPHDLHFFTFPGISWPRCISWPRTAPLGTPQG